MSDANAFSFGTALRVTGARRNQLTSWLDKGLIKADVAEAGGRGKHRRFSLLNLIQIAAACELAKFRLPGVAMSRALPKVRKALKEGYRVIVITGDVTNPKSWWFGENRDEFVNDLKAGELTFGGSAVIVDLDVLIRVVEQKTAVTWK